MLMTVEIDDYEIIPENNRRVSLEYRLDTPNGVMPHKSGSVEVAFNAVDNLPVISKQEMQNAQKANKRVYFSERFIQEIGKILVMRFSGQHVTCFRLMPEY